MRAALACGVSVRGEGLLQPTRGEPVGPLILGVTGMALDPVPLHIVPEDVGRAVGCLGQFSLQKVFLHRR